MDKSPVWTIFLVVVWMKCGTLPGGLILIFCGAGAAFLYLV